MKREKSLFWLFVGMFAVPLIVGVGLTIFSLTTHPIPGTSTIEFTISKDQLGFKLGTGVPGLFLTGLGFLGMLTLLIKIPVRALLPKPTVEKDGYEIAQSLGQYYPKQSYDWLIGKRMKVPLLFYWLFYRNGPYVRARDRIPG